MPIISWQGDDDESGNVWMADNVNKATLGDSDFMLCPPYLILAEETGWTKYYRVPEEGSLLLFAELCSTSSTSNCQ